MKKTIQKETHFCDACGKEEFYIDHCLSCGKEHCYQCKKTEGREYRHGVYIMGTGDGYYCRPCDTKLAKSKDDLHEAYQNIAKLREECDKWNADFEARKEAAEAHLRSLAKP